MASMAWFRRMVAIFGSTVADGAIGTAQLADGAVNADKIADGTVVAAEIAAGAIEAAHLAAKAVENAAIGDKAVDTGQIADAAVETLQIADLAVTAGKLAAGVGGTPGAGSVVNAMVADAAGIAQSKVALASGKIPVGQDSGAAAEKTISGDVTIDKDGVAAIAAGAIGNADIAAGAVIALSKLAALAATNIVVGSAGNVPTAVAMSGDATLGNDGALTIADNAVNAAKIADAAAILATQLEALGDGEIITGADGANAKVAMAGDVTMDKAGATVIAALAVDAGKIAAAAAIAVTQLEGLADGEILIGVTGAGAGNAKVVPAGDVTIDNAGATLLNAAHAEQLVQVPIQNLAAGDDIVAQPVFVHPRANTLQSIGILSRGTPAGIDAGNPAVLTLKDDAGNTIVTKTYNAGTVFPTEDYEDLGALDGTHKILTAGEHVTLTIDQGATADLPAFDLVIVTVPINA